MADLRVKLNFQKNFENIIKQPIINAAEKALDRYRPILKERAQELAPFDTGALQASHFIKKLGPLLFEYGFKETDRTRERSRSENHPDGFFYGLWYHELGFIPGGPALISANKKWLDTAYKDTTDILEKFFVAELRKRHQV